LFLLYIFFAPNMLDSHIFLCIWQYSEPCSNARAPLFKNILPNRLLQRRGGGLPSSFSLSLSLSLFLFLFLALFLSHSLSLELSPFSLSLSFSLSHTHTHRQSGTSERINKTSYSETLFGGFCAPDHFGIEGGNIFSTDQYSAVS
jgi:hypothetical protein